MKNSLTREDKIEIAATTSAVVIKSLANELDSKGVNLHVDLLLLCLGRSLMDEKLRWISSVTVAESMGLTDLLVKDTEDLVM